MQVAVAFGAALCAFALLAASLAWIQNAASLTLGHPIIDRSDEWHPLSLLLLLIVPALLAYSTAARLGRGESSS